ncbi:SGNH/GDSL hydrolase family protein [Agrococcus beijingensis]|uniref:SGNH/GDSL hydrolase family protein n=1 Tax=Agrococcus beijingensis TaxID=3068634 RepID=UPI0027405033|nr:SGNH/GDSL hydrolase family protein [Agrococcus sp. REN33]
MLALFAGIAVGASALLGAAPASAADPPPVGFAYVALGDSEAAGTGLLPAVQQDCLRSLKAYPIIIAPQYGGVASHACAGATTGDASNPAPQPGTAVQQARDAIAAGRLGPATELVTITVGINDISWLSLLVQCSDPVNELTCAGLLPSVLAGVPAIGERVGQLVAMVRGFAPQADVVVGGYPHLFGEITTPCSIGSFQGQPVSVSPALAGLANGGVTAVNRAIAAGAAAAGGIPAPIEAAFEGHGLCDTSGPWVSGLVNGKKTADRGLHLNWPGQRAYAAAILAEL